MSAKSEVLVPLWWTTLAQLWLGLAVLTTLGCAGSADPATPSAAPQFPSSQSLPRPIQTGPQSVQAPFGFFRATIDTATGSATLAPLPVRSGAAFTTGDTAIPDLTALFTDPNGLCGDCIQLSGIATDPVTNETLLEVTVTHPIPTGRPELSAFDIQLLVASDLPSQPVLAFPALGESVHPPFLTNADGYTNQLTASLEAALGTSLSVTLFPFVNIAVDDTAGNFAGSNVNGFADVANPSGHNIFASGDSDTVTLRFDLDNTPQVELVFAISGSFYRAYTTKGANLFQKNNPVYFAPEGNRREAWDVDTTLLGSALRAGDATSVAVLDIAVRDWQHGLAPAGTFDPLEADPSIQPRDAISATSDVASVTVEIPGITGPGGQAVNVTPTGDGRTTPLLFADIEVPNSASGAAGTYTGLVRVRDSATPETAGPGEGDVLFQDGATFGGLTAYDTFDVFTVAVADDYVFVGGDFTNVGSKVTRTGATFSVEESLFTGIGTTVSNAAIDQNAAIVVSSGAFPSGNGRIQRFHLATGALECEYVCTGGENPFDVALLGNGEVYVTNFNTNNVYRLNLDPDFTGTRLLATIDLTPYADPGYLPRPQEIDTLSGGRVFATGAHLNAGFTAAPAGLLFELNPTNNTVIRGEDTIGVRNCWGMFEYPGGTRVGVVGPGTYSGDGGSGSFNLGTNAWTADPYPVGLAWTECATTSTGRVLVSDAFTATLAHFGVPFSGTVNHQLATTPPPAPPFPFNSSVRVDSDDYIYATEFNGSLRIWDGTVASAAVAPVVVADLTVPGGADALGVREN